ncbi:MAG TPA: hypothetical protein VK939_07495 [Longimicrobiales bacterium]|nr:hypothetical protein [Longimicrobiales bacterium]
MRRVMLALLLLAAACGSPTEGERDFSLVVRRADALLEQRDSVFPGLGAIFIEGTVNIGCNGGRLTAELQRPAARQLVFITHAEWPTGACEPPGESFQFEALVRALAPGQWHLQVLHTSNTESAPPRTAFQDFVTVP